MFNTKQKALFEVPVPNVGKTTTSKSKTSSFVQAGLMKDNFTSSENGAVKLKSTLNDFVDQFGIAGSYIAPRQFNQIAADMQLLYSQNPLDAVKFAVYLRTITRKTTLLNGETFESPQKGAGLKFESIMRFMWLGVNQPTVFFKNLDVFIAAGSWHDYFTMLQYDLIYNGWDNRKLDWEGMKQFLVREVASDSNNNLILK